MRSIVKAVNLNKYYDEYHALRDINIEVEQGEVMCIIGPSGSGKSTLLRCVNQLEKIDKGGLWVDGERLLDKEKEVANFALLDGGTLAVRLALAANATNGEQVLEQLVKHERQGDILMAQISVEEKGDTGGATVEVTSRQIRTYIGVIQSDGQYLSAMVFLNSIQAGHLPFTWGLYNTKLKRFVLGGASEDFRLQEYLKVRG